MACRRRKQQPQQEPSADEEQQDVQRYQKPTPTITRVPASNRLQQLHVCRRPSRQDDNGENVSGLLASPMPSYLFLHSLPGASRQSRRAYFEVIPRQSRSGVFVQFSSKCRLRTCRRASSFDRTTRSRRYLLRML